MLRAFGENTFQLCEITNIYGIVTVMNTTLLIAFFVVLVISGVFSMFGKGGGSLQ
ncbi:MAG: hypothetical protein QHJ82_05245 [Verrucomicrobiota bacterium]|nr:hypothetical protein [Verrucomicrobiota bacterium]